MDGNYCDVCDKSKADDKIRLNMRKTTKWVGCLIGFVKSVIWLLVAERVIVCNISFLYVAMLNVFWKNS